MHPEPSQEPRADLAPRSVGYSVLVGAGVGVSVGLFLGVLAPIALLPNPDIAPLIGFVVVTPVSLLIGALCGLLLRVFR
jgi:hypothetical protein